MSSLSLYLEKKKWKNQSLDSVSYECLKQNNFDSFNWSFLCGSYKVFLLYFLEIVELINTSTNFSLCVCVHTYIKDRDVERVRAWGGGGGGGGVLRQGWKWV